MYHLFDPFRDRLDEYEIHTKVIHYGIPAIPYPLGEICKIIMNSSLKTISKLKDLGVSHRNIDVWNVALVYSCPILTSVKLVGEVDVDDRSAMEKDFR